MQLIHNIFKQFNLFTFQVSKGAKAGTGTLARYRRVPANQKESPIL
jgi:hypothetical protein